MKVMTEGRKEGAKRNFVAGDPNVELGFLCMDEDDSVKCIYGPMLVQCGGRPCRFQKGMWWEILTELICKAMCARLGCDGKRDKASTHIACGKHGRRSQLDCMHRYS